MGKHFDLSNGKKNKNKEIHLTKSFRRMIFASILELKKLHKWQVKIYIQISTKLYFIVDLHIWLWLMHINAQRQSNSLHTQIEIYEFSCSRRGENENMMMKRETSQHFENILLATNDIIIISIFGFYTYKMFCVLVERKRAF